MHADATRFTLSDLMIGANMEDLHYQMVGGLDSQMLHGESFFEHSPTELAPRKSPLDGFATVNGIWAADDGVVTVAVRPSDGTSWVETGLDGGQSPAAPSDIPAKDPGARLTSLEPAAPDAIATRGSFRFPAGEDRPASLIAHVHPNHSDNGWSWYSGYTVELDPGAQKVRGRLALHLELATFAHERGQRILFDSHSFRGAATVEGIAAFARWLQRLAPDPAAVAVGILEFNAGAFDFYPVDDNNHRDCRPDHITRGVRTLSA